MQETGDGGWLQFTTIFSDGYSLQLARMTGSVEEGLVATLSVPI